jgi:IS605 OrfB family transposase
MSILTYCKGIPTPEREINPLGNTQLEMFLEAYCPIFHKAACATVECLQSGSEFNKSSWNTYLQTTFGINKRHANGVISFAKGAVDSAKECRSNHIKQLEGQLKSTEAWIKKAVKKLKNARKFYAKKNWQRSETGCNFPLSCSLQFKNTNWRHLKFQLHHKQRKAYLITRKLECLKVSPIRVVIPRNHAFIVGSKDETAGNQVCQWDGNEIKIRVPAILEDRFGANVTSAIGDFPRKINRLPIDGAKTWHFYRKDSKWCVAVQFTPARVDRVSSHYRYGCIGIDMNPGSIGWSYLDGDGNLKAHGHIPLLMGLPKGQQDAQIVDACLQLAALATTYACPVFCEDLDFAAKKAQLREKGRKYARMLSGWAYSRFYELLESILSNRGIYLKKVNPAYTSLIGMVKFARMYGLGSDCAAAMAIARRGMRLSEKIPSSITASLSVKEGQHVWSLWSQLNNLLKKAGTDRSRMKRHTFYSVPNWELLVKQKEVRSSLSSKLSGT